MSKAFIRTKPRPRFPSLLELRRPRAEVQGNRTYFNNSLIGSNRQLSDLIDEAPSVKKGEMLMGPAWHGHLTRLG